MEKLVKKQEILNQAIATHHGVIDDFKNRINEMRSSEMLVNEDQLDYEERSFNDTTNESIEALAQQLNFAVAEMDELYKIKIEEPLHEVVGFGSVVITDNRKFFISVSVEDFKVNNESWFGISTKTPLYQEMKGKKNGDSFAFNHVNYVIKDIF